MPASKNWASSTATTSVVGSTLSSSSALEPTGAAARGARLGGGIASCWVRASRAAGAAGGGLGGAAVVGPDLVVLGAGLKRVLEDLHPAAGVERAAGEPDQLLRLAGEHGARDHGQGTGAERRVLF